MNVRDLLTAIVLGCVLIFVGVAVLAGNIASSSTIWFPVFVFGLGLTCGGIAVLGATIKSLF